MFGARTPALGALVVVVMMAMTLGACSDETRSDISDAVGDIVATTIPGDGGGDESTPEPEEPEPEAPEPTTPEEEPPAAELPDAALPEAESDTDGLTTEGKTLLALVIGFGLLMLFLVARRRPQAVTQEVTTGGPPPANTGPAWRDRARMAYTDARWIHDNVDSEIAVWRATSGVSSTQPSRQAMVAREMDDRMARTMDEIYRLEAAATNPDQRDAARGVGAALTSLRSAFEARVAAHRATDLAEPAVGPTQEETEADGRLMEARGRLDSALERLTMVP